MAALRLLPMLATPGTPGEVAGPDWVHEGKWDGVRALVVSDGARVQVRARTGADVTVAYPELQPLAAHLPNGTVVDGEVVALEHGVPSFSRLQQRMHLRAPTRIAAARTTTPVHLQVFDLLVQAGAACLQEPWTRRRARLEALDLHGPAWATPATWDDLATALAEAAAQGLEGLVSKRRSSAYRPGERTRDWRKLRFVREQDVVVGGWRPGRGRRAGAVGSLLVGVHDADGALRYAGGVGSGLTGAELERLAAVLAPRVRATAPFVDVPADPAATWVEPEVVVRVRFREWTPDGRLRQPTYRGQRDDVDPRAVTRDA